MIGAVIYHRMNIAQNPDLLDAVLAAIPGRTNAGVLAYAEGILATSGAPTREWKLTPDRIVQLKHELKSGKLASLELNQQPRVQREQNLKGVSIYLQIETQANAYPFDLAFIMPDQSEEATRDLIDGLKVCFEILEGGYGFVYAAPTWNDVFMEITATPISSWDEELTPAEKEREERLFTVQDERDSIGEFVRGAYWGNFLGPATIDKLGGIEHVRNTAPVHLIQQLDGGGLYLQLTRSPLDCSTTEINASITMLADFLGPVTLTGSSAVD
jgi:hypothetical protein